MKHPVQTLAVLGLTAACAIVAIPSFAAAPDSRGAPSIRIDTHRLDLTQREVVARLYAHIQVSARKVCRDATSSSDSAPLTTFQSCYRATVETAVSSVHAPLLTALHEETTRGRTVAQTNK